MKILVTGAGGIAGPCAIKDLVKGHEVVAVDSDNLASGMYLAQKSYVVPPADDKDYLQKILEICKKEGVSVIIPTVGEELVHFAKNLGMFRDNGITVVVSNSASIDIAMDKLQTYRFFQKEKYCPKIYNREEQTFPCVVKPIKSRGSRGFQICNSQEELEVALNRNSRHFGESVIMEYLKGTEYSVYGLSDISGVPIVAIPVKRIRAVSESKQAQIIKDEEIIQTANDVARKLGIVGPWNIQIMKTDKGPKLIEINPRLGGTVSLILASGVSFVELAINIFTGMNIEGRELDYQDGLFMTRYNEEVFIKPENLAKAGI